MVESLKRIKVLKCTQCGEESLETPDCNWIKLNGIILESGNIKYSQDSNEKVFCSDECLQKYILSIVNDIDAKIRSESVKKITLETKKEIDNDIEESLEGESTEKVRWHSSIEIESYETPGEYGIKFVNNGESCSRLFSDPSKAWDFYKECIFKTFERIKGDVR